MSSTRLPWFPFYPDQWLASSFVARLTMEEQAAYLRLLLHQWKSPECGLEDDDSVLAVDSGLGPDRWKKSGPRIRKALVPHPWKSGYICDLELYELRRKQEAIHKAKVDGGKKGAARRRLPTRLPNRIPTGIPEGNLNDTYKDSCPEAEAEAEATADKEYSPPTPPQGGALKTDGIAAAASEEEVKPLDPAAFEKPNFAVGMRLLMAAPVSLARGLATEYAGSIPLREIAAVCAASATQRNPGGFARDALQGRWKTDAKLDPPDLERLAEMVSDSAKRSLELIKPEIELRPTSEFRKTGESTDDALARANAAMKKRRERERSDG